MIGDDAWGKGTNVMQSNRSAIKSGKENQIRTRICPAVAPRPFAVGCRIELQFNTMEHEAVRGGRSREDDEVAVSIQKSTFLRFWGHFDDGNAEPEVIIRDDKAFLTRLVSSNL
jgi:hypothetical protein